MGGANKFRTDKKTTLSHQLKEKRCFICRLFPLLFYFLQLFLTDFVHSVAFQDVLRKIFS